MCQQTIPVDKSINLIDNLKSPFKFSVPFTNSSKGLFTRWIHEINLKNLVNVPSGVPG